MSNLNRELRALFDEFVASVLRAVREEHAAKRVAAKAKGPRSRKKPARSEPRAAAREQPRSAKGRGGAGRPKERTRRAKLKKTPAPKRREPKVFHEGEITDPEVLLRVATDGPTATVAREPPKRAPIVEREEPARTPAIAVREGETLLRATSGGIVLRRAKRV